jgi:hypothetical protein
LRNGDTYPRLAAGFAIGAATAWRYVREAVDLLATLADDLKAATAERLLTTSAGWAAGTPVSVRVAQDRLRRGASPAATNSFRASPGAAVQTHGLGGDGDPEHYWCTPRKSGSNALDILGSVV